VPAAQRPGALAEAARLQATLPERQLLVLGGRTPAEIWQDARLWKVRQRRPRELLAALAQRLASSRAVLAGLLSLLLAAGGIAGWEAWLSRPDPATVEWQDGTLVVRNPSGRVCFVHAPEGSADQLATLFRGAPGMARVADLHSARGREVLAVPADVRSPAARLVLFGPRGRPHWDLPASRVAPTIAEEREDLRWWTVLVPAVPAGEPAVVAMRRSPQRSLCLIDCRRGRDGALLGLVGSHGHVEILIATDLDGDAREEIVAGGQVNDSAGHALLVALDPVRMRFDPAWTHVESLPRIGEPAALKNGVRWAVRVERDRWTSSLRTAFQDLSREEGGQLRAFAAADSGVGYNYYFDLTDAAAPRLVEVAMTDAYRAALTRRFGPTLTPEDVEAERSRLESAAEGLTPEGWRPLRPVAAGKAP